MGKSFNFDFTLLIIFKITIKGVKSTDAPVSMMRGHVSNMVYIRFSPWNEPDANKFLEAIKRLMYLNFLPLVFDPNLCG